jgi:hypothetical protein
MCHISKKPNLFLHHLWRDQKFPIVNKYVDRLGPLARQMVGGSRERRRSVPVLLHDL